jgi:SAM-dependent methyltransferase
VILFGAPFLPTLKTQIQVVFEFLDLKPGQKLIELGSGDGRVLIEAAKRGIYATGYELNPILFVYSWFKTRKYKDQITLKFGNYWRAEWPETDGIFVFLLNKYMKRLNKLVVQEYKNPVNLVSYAFKIPGLEASAEKSGVFLYKYNQED